MFYFVINVIIYIKFLIFLKKMIFLGFYLNFGVIGSWSVGKLVCEGMGM